MEPITLIRPPRILKNGFSLIEILVSLAIVAALVSLIFPAIKRSAESAKAAKCISHLRAIGAAVPMYSMENDGSLPPSSFSDPVEKETRLALHPYLFAGAPALSNYDALVMSLSRLNCPKGGSWTYGFNSFVSRMKLANFEQPSKQIYAIDQCNYGRWFDYNVLTWKTGDLIEASPKPHSSKVGVLFLDGHAELNKVSALNWAQATRNTSIYDSSHDNEPIGKSKFDN